MSFLPAAPLSIAAQTFDGATPAAPLADPVVAPRGDSLAFHGVTLPTRMFSDETQISTHLIAAIDATKESLDIAIYELAISEIFDALKRAKDRGVKARIILDQSHVYPEKAGARRSPEIDSLIAAGFELRTLRGGDAFGIMHNKFALFDGKLMKTGSYNWTRAADTQHYENALFDDNAARLASYQRYWQWMWESGRPVDLNNPPAKIVLDEHGKSVPMPPAPQDTELPVRFKGLALPAQSYTPHGTVARIVAAIDKAETSLVVANFSFTHHDIIDALQRAKIRGVEIRIVFDASQYGYLKEMSEMVDFGFDVRLSKGKNGQKGVMHNKFMVVDALLVKTGSFNWTFNGELNNYENAAFLNAPDDVAAWSAYFERIWAQGRAPTDADRNSRRPHEADFNPLAF
jgi:phosphatidylserine/phosphatidylglycerophosphate/cardiolipin synthase-like enzyme